MVQVNLKTVTYPSLLEGRGAFITGGSSGIGLAIAQAFVDAGAEVVITGRNQTRLDDALYKFGRNREKVHCMKFDVQDIQKQPECLEQAENLLKNVEFNILVNNAGRLSKGYPDEDGDDFDQTINTNLRAPYFLSKEFATELINKNRGGNILNICSSSSVRPAVNAYALSKWGMRGLTLGLAKLLIPYGIVVNGIAPGPTATPMLLANGNDDYALPSSPIGRYITPEEIANMAVQLVSDMGRSIVGDLVYMTGGAGTITQDDIQYKLS